MKVYKSFEEVEDEIRLNTPEIIYKYRDWEISNHRRTITDLELWFAHPHSLNDPYDVRPPYKFIIGQLDADSLREKLKDAGSYYEPSLSEMDLEVEIEKRLEGILNDPVDYLKKSRGNFVLEKSNYDTIGILSCCSVGDNESMWAHYGENQTGFAIGFKTKDLAKAMKGCTLGYIDYNDEPINYYYPGENEGIIVSQIFKKSSRWKVEQELRFAMLGINSDIERLVKFPVETVEEIILGSQVSNKTEKEILKETSAFMPNVPVYKLFTKVSGYGFEKERIN